MLDIHMNRMTDKKKVVACVCVYLFVRIRLYLCKLYKCTCALQSVHLFEYMCVPVCMRVCVPVCMCASVYARACAPVYMRVRACLHMRVIVHPRMHMQHTPAYVQARRPYLRSRRSSPMTGRVCLPPDTDRSSKAERGGGGGALVLACRQTVRESHCKRYVFAREEEKREQRRREGREAREEEKRGKWEESHCKR